ncbi:MAG: hypothetical protein R3F38_16505 [Gammaproteobacteria bacterium]
MMYPAGGVVRCRMNATGLVPSTARVAAQSRKVAEKDLSSLRYILQAGGAMPVPLTKDVMEHMSRQLYVCMVKPGSKPRD